MNHVATEFVDALHRLEESSNVDVIADLFADDAVLSNPLAVHDEEGAVAAKVFWKAYRGAFEEVASEFVNVVEADGCAMLEWRSEGTVQGKSVSYSGVSVLEFDADKITSFRAYFDPRALVASAGSLQTSSDVATSEVERDPNGDSD